MKKAIKKLKFVYYPLKKVDNTIIKTMTIVNPTLATKFLFRRVMGYNLNLENPKTFNEKIQWLKLNEENQIMIQCGDKYGVRKYAEDKGLKEILCDFYGRFENEEEIDFEKFPEKFVLKISNSSGQNLIVSSKKDLDFKEVKKQLKNWKDQKFGLHTAEPHYQKMDSKIICEEYLEDKEKGELEDYKVYCFNGEPLFLMICTGRAKKSTKYYFFDFEWNPLNYNRHSDNLIKGIDEAVQKPKNLDKIYEYSKILAKDIKFVRVDFYNISGRIILGEMTFTPCGGLDSNLPKDIDLMMGKLIKL
ncbi:MAG: ATP-grasp fold amidoligase family protein [Cetobacterium sp.]